MDRDKAITVTFGGIGRGTVVRNLPAEDLFIPNEQGLVLPTASPSSTNVHLFEGEARRRRGYVAYGDQPDARPVNGLFKAEFGGGQTTLIRASCASSGSTGGVDKLVEGTTNVFSPIDNGVAFNNVTNEPWAFTMAPAAGGRDANTLVLSNPRDEQIYQWPGRSTMRALATGAPHAAKVLTTFLSRCMACNIIDSSTGVRQPTRVHGSIVGDSDDWTGLGSFTLDLDADPYPIVHALVMGNRLVIFKGGANGGAIYLLTPTGSSVTPLTSIPINPENGVGAFIPRSVVTLTPGSQVFFVGHDALYRYDGVRALQPFGQDVARDIISRATLEDVWTGFAVYHPREQIVELHIAVDASTTPNEFWIINPFTGNIDGPHAYNNNMLAGVHWIEQGQLTWATWGQVGPRTWANITDAAGDPYGTWENIDDGLGTERVAYGSGTGFVYESDSSRTDDAGTNITCDWRSPTITPDKLVREGTQQPMRPDDVLILRHAVLRHSSTVSWTPIVEVTTNGGGAWTLVSAGSAVSSTSGRLAAETYYVEIDGESFQFRVRNTSGDALNFHSLQCEFTYAGSGRHD